MSVSYKKLWHLLLDKNMKKRDLQRLTGISDYTIKKLTRDENVPVAVLGKISRALDCSIEEFVDFYEE